MTEAPTDLAANLAALEVRCVHVYTGETLAHGLQGRIEITRVNAGPSTRPGILSNIFVIRVFGEKNP